MYYIWEYRDGKPWQMVSGPYDDQGAAENFAAVYADQVDLLEFPACSIVDYVVLVDFD